uniref:ankyrin repeat-containing protein BDA1-like n=1 Tax=Ziziphus jujuba TaxID=326968 RepID=A0A6P3YR62_ZIZJJ
MEITIRDGDDRMVRLYEASAEGCTASLNSLMEEDPRILSKISLNSLGETPLHISASLGHLNFTKQLVSQKPKLAEELDLLKRSPLHLASAEGHTEIVKALIEVNKDMCLVRDEDGKIPLHYAAMRGRVEVIEMLISAEPKSIQEKLNEGETVLHLCVQYNQLEALKVLVGSILEGDIQNDEFLNSKDQEYGNTILHLAVMLKQIETIKYLVLIPEVKTGASSLNRMGFTAFRMIEQLPKDFKSIKILNILQDALGPHPQTQKHDDNCKESSDASCWRQCLRYIGKYNVDWVKDRSGSLMVAATVTASMTFQTAVNPPGGVWQEDTTTTTFKIDNNTYCGPGQNQTCIAGTSVLGYIWKDQYMLFLAYNSIAFLSALSIIFLLLTGFPVTYKPFMWLLNLAIAGNITFMALTFMEGMYLVAPLKIQDEVTRIYYSLFYTWIAIVGIVILQHTIRLVNWAFKKILKHLKSSHALYTSTQV